jgi:hypothetical protein
MSQDKAPPFTEQEIQNLAMTVLKGSGPSTEAELLRFVRWCEGAVVDAGLVRLAALGKMTVKLAEIPEDWVWDLRDRERG